MDRDHDFAKAYRVLRVILQVIQIMLDLYRTYTFFVDRRRDEVERRRREGRGDDDNSAGSLTTTRRETQVGFEMFQCSLQQNF